MLLEGRVDQAEKLQIRLTEELGAAGRQGDGAAAVVSAAANHESQTSWEPFLFYLSERAPCVW
jgi:hypothetical protein